MVSGRLGRRSLLLLACGPVWPQARSGVAPGTYEIDGRALRENRSKALAGDARLAGAIEKIRSRADALMNEPLWAVTDKAFAGPSGDKHDYVTLGSYFWPDPTKPDGLPYILRDGELNPEVHEYDRRRLDGMCALVHTLALAHYLTGEKSYAERAGRQMRRWFFDAPTKMNPHLRNAQMVKGKNEGNPFGLIETAALTRVIDGVALLRASGAWSEEDHRRLQAWFREYLAWLQTSDLGKREDNAPNNHGTYYDLQAVTFALFAGDEALARQVLGKTGERRIARHIAPDGSQPAELTRTRSLHYTLLNSTGLFRLASLGERVGVDLWNYRTADGRSIRATLDWLIPFATGKKPWEHKEIGRQSWAPIVRMLRQAAAAYRSSFYEQIISQVPDVENEIMQLNLLCPPASK